MPLCRFHLDKVFSQKYLYLVFIAACSEFTHAFGWNAKRSIWRPFDFSRTQFYWISLVYFIIQYLPYNFIRRHIKFSGSNEFSIDGHFSHRRHIIVDHRQKIGFWCEWILVVYHLVSRNDVHFTTQMSWIANLQCNKCKFAWLVALVICAANY